MSLICSSDWVFAEKNRQDGNISEEGFQYYMQLRSRMLQNLPRPHDLIFLDVSAEVCYARVHTVRQRVSGSYLASLTCFRSVRAAFRSNTCAALTAAIASGLPGCARKARLLLSWTGTVLVRVAHKPFCCFGGKPSVAHTGYLQAPPMVFARSWLGKLRLWKSGLATLEL